MLIFIDNGENNCSYSCSSMINTIFIFYNLLKDMKETSKKNLSKPPFQYLKWDNKSNELKKN